jgi:hypothetical protein
MLSRREFSLPCKARNIPLFSILAVENEKWENKNKILLRLYLFSLLNEMKKLKLHE